MSGRRAWTALAVDGLPDRLILFDGVCLFCSRWVRFVIARDPAARFRFVAIQHEYGLAVARRLGIDPENPETNAVILGGHAYYKSDAALAVLSHLPRWSWVRVLRRVPRRLRDPVYDLIARSRYRIFGRSEACLIPTPDLAGHFFAGGGTPG